MTYLKRVRWMSCSAVLAALFLFSGNASAIMVTMDSLTPTGGTLVLNFEGLAGAEGDGLLEGSELASFSAVYTSSTDPMQINWAPLLPDPLLVFLYDITTGIVESLYIDNLDPFANEAFVLQMDSSSGGTQNGHYAEVRSLFTGEVVASTNVIPSPDGEVPAPGTLLLLALGLLAIAMGGRQMSSSRARLPS